MPSGTQAINLALPPIRGSTPGPYSVVQTSGHSTSIARAPKTLVPFPGDAFTNCLQSPTLLHSLQIQVLPITTERSHNLATEGDIERAAAIYLLHDVNLIIEDLLINRLHINPAAVECLGQSTTGTSRPDIKYVVNGRTILIVEYKHTDSLRDNDWTEFALVRPNRTAQQIINSIPAGVQTALRDNAAIISKQASKYSSQCGLVVLCNYQNMIVLDFTPGHNNARWNDLTDPVKYYFSNGQTMTHKRLLLATLIYGLRKVGINV
ncbi:uncharacterized protein EV420DRAFT_745836 [Desarmillaria tabescens]|uniref:Uncharacterized protein n=1 Tax=Armillaria tabescens TaxID=1929756 RepID=A0AA39JX80_ARMTA|nr:uncharacterized protein EV420DRAFT_745836 [Desarmillaria tabescens]KAK0450282.1 hypothetical protein EV420DRAFT_745836 [Desarmillaria tabescens]